MLEAEIYFSYISEYVTMHTDKTDKPYIYPHIHNYYEVNYNIRGAEGYMVEGVFYKCNERDLVIIPPFCTHKVIIDRDYDVYERCHVNIDSNLMEVLSVTLPDKKNLDWLSHTQWKATLTKSQHNEYIRMIKKYKNGDKLGALAEILPFLKSSFENAGEQEYMDENSISHTDRLMMIIEKNFKNLTVSEIAEKAHCDSDYLNRLFKSKLDITVKHYLVLRKLAEAQKLLGQGKSVKETCHLAGFNDYSNFLRTFKKHLGYTPGEFEGRKK